jgi:hypothetical protein
MMFPCFRFIDRQDMRLGPGPHLVCLRKCLSGGDQVVPLNTSPSGHGTYWHTNPGVVEHFPFAHTKPAPGSVVEGEVA